MQAGMPALPGRPTARQRTVAAKFLISDVQVRMKRGLFSNKSHVSAWHGHCWPLIGSFRLLPEESHPAALPKGSRDEETLAASDSNAVLFRDSDRC
jgi:hypothetical protein